MTAKYLLKRHKEFSTHVEAAVWDDLLVQDKEIPTKTKRRTAYNAAFFATYEHHKRTK